MCVCVFRILLVFALYCFVSLLDFHFTRLTVNLTSFPLALLSYHFLTQQQSLTLCPLSILSICLLFSFSTLSFRPFFSTSFHFNFPCPVPFPSIYFSHFFLPTFPFSQLPTRSKRDLSLRRPMVLLIDSAIILIDSLLSQTIAVSCI